MKLPSMQFYPGDWMKDPNLRRCSRAARGMWIDMLCLMFECEDRGVFATGGVPWSDEDIAAAIGGDSSEGLSCVTELLLKGVCHRNQSGAIFSKRMVRDERTRQERVKAGSIGGSKPKAKLKQAPNQNGPPSSSSSSSGKERTPNGDGKPSATSFWDVGESLLVAIGWTKKNARTFIGNQVAKCGGGSRGEDIVAAVVAKASLKRPADPAAWIAKSCQEIKKASNGPEALTSSGLADLMRREEEERHAGKTAA